MKQEIDHDAVQQWVFDWFSTRGYREAPDIGHLRNSCPGLVNLSHIAIRNYIQGRPDLFKLLGNRVFTTAMLVHTKDPLFCDVCGLWLSDAQKAVNHVKQNSHKNFKIFADKQNSKKRQRRLQKAAFCCATCKFICESQKDLQEHLESARHRSAVIGAQLSVANISTQGANSLGITVSELADFGTIAPHKSATHQLKICNHGSQTVLLRKCSLLQPTPEVSLSDMRGLCIGQGVSLPAGQSLNVLVTVSSKHLGIVRRLISLEVHGLAKPILRKLSATFDEIDSSMPDLKPTAPYQPKARPKTLRPTTQVVDGERPPKSRMKFVKPPGQHQVPLTLMKAVEQGRLAELEEKLTAAPTDMAKYADKYQSLLFLEEIQHEIDIRQYDMEAVTMDVSGKFLALQVPGLAENRPSVMKGDSLYVKPSDGSSGNKEWRGYVHVVEREEVHLKFDAKFHQNFITKQKYNVRFEVNRSTFVFMHEAIKVAGQGGVNQRTVLPVPMPRLGVPQGPADSRITWVNRILNEEQQAAVRTVVQGGQQPLAHLIFGPPGTGKTTAVVEAARQVHKLIPGSKLLMCAPSNSAADLLAQRLLMWGVPKSELIRVNAFQRPYKELPADLVDVSFYDSSDDAFILPDKQAMMASKVRVVVTTCMMAAKVYAQGVPAGHFTHIFVDEAGHAEEPLTLCPMILMGPATLLVLAGDPQQLGPIVLSSTAKKCGLQMSLIERLMKVEPYKRRETQPHYDPQYVTKLVKNYRSHPSILEQPNLLFYNMELQPCADETVYSLTRWDGLPRQSQAPGFPMLFHSLRGKDSREGNSPSWFNEMEIKQVWKYVEALMAYKPARLTAREIGIVTPYRKQAQRIRAVVRGKLSGAELKVGSVEEFQGQERKVIIISTVRSSSEHISFDLKHKLGFLSNPKRFNVAITRAKALVIIVGNPDVLVQDSHWASLMRFIQQNGGCCGGPMPSIPDSQGGVDTDQAALINQFAKWGLSDASRDDGMQSELEGPVAFSGVAVEGGEMYRLM